MTMLKTLGALVLVLAAGGVAEAADTFLTGDVMVSTSGGNFQQWRKVGGTTWTLIDTLNNGSSSLTTGSAFDSAGNFYGTGFNSHVVTEFTGPGVAHTASTFATTDSTANVESIVFDAAGNAYVGQATGSTHDILKYSSTGTFLARYTPTVSPRGTDWIDLAADQHTMFYSSEGRVIRRFDVSTNTQLSDFVTLSGAGETYALRLLSDGGLLVADGDNVKRLDSTGAVVTTYDVTGLDNWFALNLDPDGTSFWSSSYFGSGDVYKFDIATGAVLEHFATGVSQQYGLSIFGERTAATVSAVPLPPAAWMGLGMLGALAGLGAIRRRRMTAV